MTLLGWSHRMVGKAMVTRAGFLAVVITLFVAIVGGQARAQSAPDKPLKVVVTIPPLMWAAKEIAPSNAEITLILTPGKSEHGIELTPSQVKAINDADLVVMVGYGLEPRIENSLKRSDRPARRVVSFEGLDGHQALEADHDHAHVHGHDHAHHDHGFDPHLWLDPPAMRAFVKRVGEAMSQLVPESDRSRVQEATTRLQGECDAIDAEYRKQIAELSNKVIVTHHNAYAYVAKRYGLEVAAVIRPIESIEPAPGDIKAVATTIRERNLKAIFVEPQFSAKAAQRIADTTGVKLLTLDPLGEGDWAATMRQNLAALVEGLK